MMYSDAIGGDENTHYLIAVEVINKPFPKTDARTISTKGNVFDPFYERGFVTAPSVMMRISVYDRLGLYDEEIGIEDWDYYLCIAKDGNIGYLNDYTVMYQFYFLF